MLHTRRLAASVGYQDLTDPARPARATVVRRGASSAPRRHRCLHRRTDDVTTRSDGATRRETRDLIATSGRQLLGGLVVQEHLAGTEVGQQTTAVGSVIVAERPPSWAGSGAKSPTRGSFCLLVTSCMATGSTMAARLPSTSLEPAAAAPTVSPSVLAEVRRIGRLSNR